MNWASESAAERMRIVVLGYVVRCPLGGMAWHYLQYAMGLARLGHEVYYLEDSDDVAWCCYDPTRHVTDSDPSYGLAFARAAFGKVGLADRWAYYDAHTSRWHGMPQDRVRRIVAAADVLVNVSGANPLRPWLEDIPVRIYLDTDPAFTQVRHLTDPERRRRTSQHTAWFSFGEDLGRPECRIPDDGFPWRPTRQPVVLDAWPATPGDPAARWTTVMQWESDPDREYAGVRYGQKRTSFADYIDLPSRVRESLELALGGRAAPHETLRRRGWRPRDPLEVTRDLGAYQHYLQQSKGEFGVAKQGYVVGQCGWFSERSACYLASARPVVVQDTGFTTWMPTGEGVLSFSGPEEAVAAIEEVNRRYAWHCRRAREIAESFFRAEAVLTSLIERAISA